MHKVTSVSLPVRSRRAFTLIELLACQPKPWRRQARSAFTLIELLVVIAIIGILAAMLLPALNKAREKGYAAVCVSNMHQWALALNMYNDDWAEYYPYDGMFSSPPCVVANSNAWFNVLTPYVQAKTLCQLYAANTPPTPRTGHSIFVCPSAVNKSPTMDPNNAIFYYSLSTCLHMEGNTAIGFRRDRMQAPSTTIVFCEEVEDAFPETNGQYDLVNRHSGGSNFVLADGHVEWIELRNFCRQGNTLCPTPLSNIQWDNSGAGGDWKNGIPYHWWPFPYANTSAN
ncbi:MAG TPA: prepilin-type N-terminal cleavage/methylation domain-containing protein [Verrucomicrobiae bacterium]|nr:prepilin-type N-terminal cleavage/methylation domain-containing protein [Verrucomicrobiae bacterium]